MNKTAKQIADELEAYAIKLLDIVTILRKSPN